MPKIRESRIVLAAHADYLETVHGRIHAAMEMDPPREARAAEPIGKRPVAGAGVMPLHGVIVGRGPRWWMDYGLCVCEHWIVEFEAMVDDKSITGIVIDVDSPGGTVEGVQELADRVFMARKKKPIVSIANHMMASAAYWIGSAATKVYATANAQVGSIGVYSMHFDYSKLLEEEGVKVTIFRAGENKAEFNPYEPLSEETKQYEQKTIETLKDNFVRVVATHRGRSFEDVDSAKWGQGRLFMAADAKTRGLVDRIIDYQDLVARMANGKLRLDVQGALAEEWETSTEDDLAEREIRAKRIEIYQRGLTRGS